MLIATMTSPSTVIERVMFAFCAMFPTSPFTTSDHNAGDATSVSRCGDQHIRTGPVAYARLVT
jgi:hypothetical protein